MLIINAVRANQASGLAEKGLLGTFGFVYGPFPTWVYQALTAVTHDLVVLATLHGALLVSATAGALWWVSRSLRLWPWFAVVPLAVALLLVLRASVVGQPVPDSARARSRSRDTAALPDHGVGVGAARRGRGDDCRAARSFDEHCARRASGPAHGCSPGAGVVEASDQRRLDRVGRGRDLRGRTGTRWRRIRRSRLPRAPSIDGLLFPIFGGEAAKRGPAGSLRRHGRGLEAAATARGGSGVVLALSRSSGAASRSRCGASSTRFGTASGPHGRTSQPS